MLHVHYSFFHNLFDTSYDVARAYCIVLCCAEQVSGLGRSLMQRHQPSVSSFALSQSQIDHFTKCLVKAVVTDNVKFSFIESVHFAEALKALGIPSISRMQLANKHIPHVAKEANVATKDVLLRSPLVDASSDGWRKIAICAAEKAKMSPSEEFELTLSVVEGND
jgi:hypothetical protein